MNHRLKPLLNPDSVAVLGASAKAETVSRVLLSQIRLGGFGGRVYPVHPKNQEVEGFQCYPSLGALPEVPDHVIFCIADSRLEEAFETAAGLGVKAATLLSPLFLERDLDPPLKERIREIANRHGMLLVGGNCNGFYNFDTGLWACGFRTRASHRPGGISLFTHSGSLFNAIVDTDERLAYNLVVSTGQELNVSLADYVDYAVDQPSTKVIGLFMETARDPQGLRSALEKAADRDIPVVVLKVGRTEQSAKLAASHSGALVGNDGAYQALFDRYGVIRVESIDELAFTLLMFSHAYPLGPGGLASIHDSGGERELIIDLADQYDVPFGMLDDAARAEIARVLAPGLPVENPLDAWHSWENYEESYGGGFAALMRAPNVAIGAIVGDLAPSGEIYPEYIGFAERAKKETGKPVCVIANHQGTGSNRGAIDATHKGIPAFDGLPLFLKSVGHLFRRRDFMKGREGFAAPATETVARSWSARLEGGDALDDQALFEMMNAFGLPMNPGRDVSSADQAVTAAIEIGFPVVLKTAEAGIAHKSDVGGVQLNLTSPEAVAASYRDMAGRLGRKARISRMVTGGGVEIILGVTQDPQFGPIVMVGSGGIYAELLKDVVTALPPFGPKRARALLDRLKLRALLDGLRGAEAADLEKLAKTISDFSVMAASLGSALGEIDLNPVLARPDGAIAVDALHVPVKNKIDEQGMIEND